MQRWSTITSCSSREAQSLLHRNHTTLFQCVPNCILHLVGSSSRSSRREHAVLEHGELENLAVDLFLACRLGGQAHILHHLLPVDDLNDIGLGLVGDDLQGQDAEGVLDLDSNLLNTCTCSRHISMYG